MLKLYLRERTDLRIHQRQKFSSKSLKGLSGVALPHGGDAYRFLVLSVCLFVTLWIYKVCDNGNAMKQCYFQNNYGVVAYVKVCSCAPVFNFFCGPPQFIALLGVVSPHFSSHSGEIWAWGCEPGTTTLKPIKYRNNRLREYTPLGHIYTNNWQFWQL